MAGLIVEMLFMLFSHIYSVVHMKHTINVIINEQNKLINKKENL